MKKKSKTRISGNNDIFKILMTMKFMFMLLFITSIHMFGSVYSQTTKLTLELNGPTMKEVFKAIEDQSEYKFLYHESLVSKDQYLEVHAQDQTIDQILNSLFEGTNNSYTVLNNNLIVITPKSNAQQQKVTGTVSDATTGEPLIGVYVVIEGTQTGTVTDGEGRYTVDVSDSKTVLVFSSIGYVSERIIVGINSVIDVRLTPDIQALEEVVVIGYGTVKKKDLTGSISSVKSEDFNQGAITDPMQLIQGRIAGLSVIRTNGGDPTSNLEVRLRGASSISASEEPLVVIDGISGGDLNTIAPEDIESIDILKDGSAAAIYGTRGTNGVILVTTKKGKAGHMQVEYSANVTVQTILKKTEVLSADEYRALKTSLLSSGDDSKVSIANSMIDYGADTDWFDVITRDLPINHIHHLALSGGVGNTNYRTSVFYSDKQGMLLKSSANDLRMSFNLTQYAFNDRLKLNAQIGLTSGNNHPVNYEAYRQAIKRNPTEPVYNDDGSMYEVDGWQYYNPLGILQEVKNDVKQSSYFGKVNANVSITDDLSADVLAGIQKGTYWQGYYEYSYSRFQELNGTSGYASITDTTNTVISIESTLEWNKKLANHSIDLIGGYSFQEFDNRGCITENTNFISDDLTYNNIGSGTYLSEGLASMESNRSKSRLVGFFARGAYNYANKYFIMASVRHEGSSKFGDNDKWGTFPAISVAWNISEESFLKDKGFELLKVRAGYGVTGNQGIDPYLSMTRLNQSGYYYYNGEWKPAYIPVSNPNPNLKWETKHETNIGIDWLLSNGRIGGSVDYYNRKTKDLLDYYDVPVPPNLYSTTMANVGSMRNSGIEISLNTVPVKTNDLLWNVNVNFEHRKNKVISLSNDTYSLEYRNVGNIGAPGVDTYSHQYREGEAIGNFYGYVYEGLTDEGKWIFRDYDPETGESDGEITTEDKAIIGNGVPDYYAGFSSSLRYKKWDMTILFRGAFGHQIINVKDIFYSNPKGSLPNNVMTKALDSPVWDDPAYSSYYVEDGDYVKLDNLTIGYSLSFKNVQWIKKGRIYVTGNNLLCLTGYSGVDPEVAVGGLTPGLDNRYDYPSTRAFTFGLSVTF